jgi:hypothetical protein
MKFPTAAAAGACLQHQRGFYPLFYNGFCVQLHNSSAADELVSHVVERGALGGSFVSVVAEGRSGGGGWVEVVVVEHEDKGGGGDKFKSSV